MEVIKDDYIRKIEAVKILQKAYTEGRIKAKDGCVSVLDDINALPKANVQPVKHGKDVMKVLQQVSDTCERTRMCMECEFYSKSTGMCVFADMPIFWKHDEIEKALRDGDAE